MDSGTSIKLVLVGPINVGKTTLARLLTFPDKLSIGTNTLPTVSPDVFTAEVELEKSYNVQVWDTSGQERYNRMTAQYVNGAHCIMFVYDHSITIDEAIRRYKLVVDLHKDRSIHQCDTTDKFPPKVPVIVLCNKVDLIDNFDYATSGVCFDKLKHTAAVQVPLGFKPYLNRNTSPERHDLMNNGKVKSGADSIIYNSQHVKIKSRQNDDSNKLNDPDAYVNIVYFGHISALKKKNTSNLLATAVNYGAIYRTQLFPHNEIDAETIKITTKEHKSGCKC